MGSPLFNLKSQYLYLLLGTLCLLPPRVTYAESQTPTPVPSYQQISQLVIVYAPRHDSNSAFSQLDESLSELMDAAQKQNLRVVLINTDDFDGINADNLIKKSIKGAVTSHPSFVILATHGGPAKTDKPQSDTSLAFGNKIYFSDLTDAFNQPNLKGLALESCHSHNDHLPKLAKNAVTCATSQRGEDSSILIGSVFNNVLSAAIRDGKSDDFATTIRNEMSKQMASKSKALRQTLLGADEDYSKLPFYGPVGMRVEFKGTKHEIVDPLGNPMSPCYYPKGIDPDLVEDTSKLHPWIKTTKQIASLPSKVVPEGTIDAITKGKVDGRPWNEFYFETYSKNTNKSQNLRMECSEQGELVINGRDDKFCMEPTVEIGENCVQSFVNMYKANEMARSALHAPSKTFAGWSPQEAAKNFCNTLNSGMESFKNAGIKIQAQSLCLSPQCYGNSFSYDVGQCTPSGGRCEATPKGNFIFQSAECGKIASATPNFGVACAATNGSVAEIGKCFIPENPGNFSLPEVHDRVKSLDQREMFVALRQKTAAYRCLADNKAQLDKACCEENKGSYVMASGAFIKDNPDYLPSDQEIQNRWTQNIMASNDFCLPKMESYQNEIPVGYGNGAMMGMSVGEASFIKTAPPSEKNVHSKINGAISR